MTCSIDDCDRDVESRGWCDMHYQRWKRHGDPLKTLLPSLEERFWSKVNKLGPVPEYRPELGPCWIWTAQIKNGYGSFWAHDRNNLAHRFAYELLVGPAPDGLELDHLCRVTACVRPGHLEPVTHQENMRRALTPTMVISRSGACHRGHPFSEENTYLNAAGHRYCRVCKRERERAPAQRRRDALVITHASDDREVVIPFADIEEESAA